MRTVEYASAFKRDFATHGGTWPQFGSALHPRHGEGLFEMRARGAEGIGRTFFCTLIGQRIVILHGFIKKSQKTPLADLRIARKRLKELPRD